MRKPKPKTTIHRMYYVEWNDHWGAAEGGWSPPGRYDCSPIKAVTVGWKIKEDRHGMLMCSSICTGDGGYSQITYILKGCIIKKKELKPLIRVIE